MIVLIANTCTEESLTQHQPITVHIMLLPGLKSLEYDDRLKVLGIWSLEERRNRADLLEVFKMKSGLSAIAFDTFFTVDSQQRTRSHTWKIVKNRSNLDVRKYFFSESC